MIITLRISLNYITFKGCLHFLLFPIKNNTIYLKHIFALNHRIFNIDPSPFIIEETIVKNLRKMQSSTV